MLKAKNIVVKIGDKMILDHVDAELQPGEVLAICGPNGAGKSTLLRVLSGELSPNVGCVEVFERALSDWNPLELAKTRAFLHQESLLTFPFPVNEVVAMGRFPHKTPERDKAIVADCLSRVGMSEFSNRIYTTLSGGEKQRVQFARALTQLFGEKSEGKLLLLDEPTSALDLAYQESTLELARYHAKKMNYGLIVVLHDLNLAANWADRILFLNRGRMHCIGSPDEVITSEIIESVYGLKTHIITHPDTKRPVVLVSRQSEDQNHFHGDSPE